MRYLNLARKADKLTYGLIYPAFFGNMVYDLILAKADVPTFKGIAFYIGLILVLYYIVDFIHLYGDLDESVGGHVENRSWAYILGDLFTSCLFFLSFVLLKYERTGLSFLCLEIVPVLLAIYKDQHALNKYDRSLTRTFALVAVLLGLVFILFISEINRSLYFFCVLIAQFLAYAWYVLIYFRNAMETQLRINNERIQS